MKRPALHTLLRALAAWLALFASLAGAQLASQPGADELAAFTQARATADPAARVTALQAFLRQFPAGTRTAVARRLLLSTLLADLPDRTAAIHEAATAQLAAMSSPLERWNEEARLALQLADAGPQGADLPDASVWAHDALTHLTELAYRRQLSLTAARYHLPSLTPRQAHLQFAADRALALSAMADVLLRQGHVPDANPLLADALGLAPLSPEANRLHAETLLAVAPDKEALGALLRADALGPLPPRLKTTELDLFRQLEHGDQATLDVRLDGLYHQLFPTPFALPRRAPLTGGHPALLELFTGSDCLPCAGADLAVDSLLGTYGPTDLVALSVDVHIPFPDPLATPDTVARAAAYNVGSTPSAFLDGALLPVVGSTRADVENIVLAFAEQIEAQAALPSGVQLSLSAAEPTATRIEAAVALTPQHTSAASTPLRSLQTDLLFVALVEDDLRYPGRNGIRFHRMVVRALRQTSAANALAGKPFAFAFDLQQLAREQAAYLAAMEQGDTAFGNFRFPVKDIPLRADHLRVVAWVQNPTTRQVLQSALAAPATVPSTYTDR